MQSSASAAIDMSAVARARRPAFVSSRSTTLPLGAAVNNSSRRTPPRIARRCTEALVTTRNATLLPMSSKVGYANTSNVRSDDATTRSRSPKAQLVMLRRSSIGAAAAID